MAPLITDYPEIAADFDTSKNGAVQVEDLHTYGKEQIWWVCKEGHHYAVSPYTRVRTKGCKVCNRHIYAEKMRRSKLAKSGSLADQRPDLITEWDLARNSSGPDDLSEKSKRKVWWFCEKGHSWQASPKSRGATTNRPATGCPDCHLAGLGDRIRADRLNRAGISLAEAHPELMSEWVIERNARDPFLLTPKSNYYAHWKCQFGHEWTASVVNRTHNQSGCPRCVNQSSRLEIFLLCELRTVFSKVDWRRRFDGVEVDIFLANEQIAIEVDGDYWHSEKLESDRRKTEFITSLGMTLVRVRDTRLPSIDGHVIPVAVRQDMLHVFRELMVVLSLLRPDREIQHHTRRSRPKAFDEYKTMVSRLPAPPPGATLADRFPDVAAEWDYEANAPLTPDLFSRASDQKVAWRCNEGHRWEATIKNRTLRKSSCPTCYRKRSSAASRDKLQ